MQQCKTKAEKASFFFLLSLIVLLLVCPASWGQSGQTSPFIPSLEEERLLSLIRAFLDRRENQTYTELNRRIVHYVRDGCKEKLQGDWAFYPQGDVVTITYDEKYQVFLGKVKSIVKFDSDVVKPGYLLFKVYFPRETATRLYWDREPTLGELRLRRICRGSFEGTEYSYKVQGGTKVKTQEPMRLTPRDQIGSTLGNEHLLEYQVEKSSFELRRVYRK